MKTLRHSGIELYKIIGILLIITAHVIQTLTDTNQYVMFNDYIIDLNSTTTNIQYIFYAILRYGGEVGNTMFFVASAWFLLESKSVNIEKILLMVIDIWIISVLILGIVELWGGIAVEKKMLIKQFFPTIFSNNWYMTCYILVYLLHPYLNKILGIIKKSELLRFNVCLLFLYYGINYILHNCFFNSNIINWIIIYFAVAYVKKYLLCLSNNKKWNCCLFVLGLCGNVFVVCLTNIMGINKLLYWDVNSPFILLMSISGFNFARNFFFKNTAVNFVSNMSMFIYIIHENMIIRYYFRPIIWQIIYFEYGYNYILMWVFLMTGCIFIITLMLSILYKETIQKITISICRLCYPIIRKSSKEIENLLLKIN